MALPGGLMGGPPPGAAAAPAAQPKPAPAGLGGMAAPQGHAGSMAAALPKVRNAVKELQDILPALPMGSPLHDAVLKAVSSISKHVDQEGQNTQGLDLQSLIQQIRAASQNAPMAALARMGGGAGGAGPNLGAPPAPVPQGV